MKNIAFNGFISEMSKLAKFKDLKPKLQTIEQYLTAEGLEKKEISHKTKKMLNTFIKKHGIGDVAYIPIKNKTYGRYIPNFKAVISPGKDPSIMLHELGHAVDYKKMQGLKMFLRKFPFLATLGGGGLLWSDEYRKYAPAMTAAGSVPLLYQEGKASALALKHLYETGKPTGKHWKKMLKGVKSLSPGMLTYMGAAAIPALAFYIANQYTDKMRRKNDVR